MHDFITDKNNHYKGLETIKLSKRFFGIECAWLLYIYQIIMKKHILRLVVLLILASSISSCTVEYRHRHHWHGY